MAYTASVLAATSGALAPSLMFRAIEQTSVTNIVLIETVEIPLGLFLAWLLYREKSSWSAVIGAFLALGWRRNNPLVTDGSTQ